MLSLPEVGGDAVMYAGIDKDSLAQAMTTLLDDAELRRDLAAKGLERATLFTWERSAELHLETYDRAWREAAATV